MLEVLPSGIVVPVKNGTDHRWSKEKAINTSVLKIAETLPRGHQTFSSLIQTCKTLTPAANDFFKNIFEQYPSRWKSRMSLTSPLRSYAICKLSSAVFGLLLAERGFQVKEESIECNNMHSERNGFIYPHDNHTRLRVQLNGITAIIDSGYYQNIRCLELPLSQDPKEDVLVFKESQTDQVVNRFVRLRKANPSPSLSVYARERGQEEYHLSQMNLDTELKAWEYFRILWPTEGASHLYKNYITYNEMLSALQERRYLQKRTFHAGIPNHIFETYEKLVKSGLLYE